MSLEMDVVKCPMCESQNISTGRKDLRIEMIWHSQAHLKCDDCNLIFNKSVWKVKG